MAAVWRCEAAFSGYRGVRKFVPCAVVMRFCVRIAPFSVRNQDRSENRVPVPETRRRVSRGMCPQKTDSCLRLLALIETLTPVPVTYIVSLGLPRETAGLEITSTGDGVGDHTTGGGLGGE